MIWLMWNGDVRVERAVGRGVELLLMVYEWVMAWIRSTHKFRMVATSSLMRPGWRPSMRKARD